MPRGFSGATVKRFFEKTNEAMTKASEAHNRRPFENKLQGESDTDISMPTIREPINHTPPFSPEDANPFNNNHKIGIGNRSNIVVEQSVYEEALKKIEETDHKAGEEIYKLCNTIEELCKTIYIVPETIPRVMEITARLKNSLPKFRELTEEVNIEVRKFIGEIGQIDQAPDGFKVVVSDEGAEHVIGSTKDVVNKQIQSMEETVRSYIQAEEALARQASSFKRQMDSSKNRMDMLDTQINTLEQRVAMESAAGLGNPLGAANPFRMTRD